MKIEFADLLQSTFNILPPDLEFLKQVDDTTQRLIPVCCETILIRVLVAINNSVVLNSTIIPLGEGSTVLSISQQLPGLMTCMLHYDGKRGLKIVAELTQNISNKTLRKLQTANISKRFAATCIKILHSPSDFTVVYKRYLKNADFLTTGIFSLKSQCTSQIYYMVRRIFLDLNEWYETNSSTGPI